ncbi:myosin heavy chain kinase [Seminavis robusta]|uniref:Myosin heavy chain kinase n=1 Tax=Seminavis robusta TaxID=568900 RepID=A0A9N8F1T1_9STRA|nr:myosin heavy chain kinase [Seminavis robusta]|eukprot:Sro2324_g323340.1 myosin heavy chain kinase (778) ;mRNA; f:3531-5864
MDVAVEKILSTQIEARRGRKWLLSKHAVARAGQRFVSFAEIRSALECGTKSAADKGAWEYRFAGVIAVVDSTETIVLTVYPEPGFGIDLDKVPISREMQLQHDKDCSRLVGDKKSWTSHTVAVIDQSGSMRAPDIDKNVTRSDLVWLTLAVDVVYHGIKSGERKSTDVMSVVFMKEDATIVVDRQPIDWILYNKLIDIMNTEKPSQGGNYIPALDVAETLLMSNRSRSCALTLLFLSDGKPSDKVKRDDNRHITATGWLERMKAFTSPRIEGLASVFGKRLNMCFCAIGPPDNSDFGVIKNLANKAREYECPVVYQKATLRADILSAALRTMSTTTTDTMTTLSQVPECHVYRDFVKMKQSEVGSPVVTDTWKVFVQSESGGPLRPWKKRIVKCQWTRQDGWSTIRAVFSDPTAIGLAWETRWFGEGKERLAKELREVGPDEVTFVGPPMVLKASITVSRLEDVDSREFHKRFCKSQLKAQDFARLFNERAASLPVTIPRIEFIPCWVYMVETEPGERKGYLVEPALDVSQYRKFNDNAGNVHAHLALKRASSRKLHFNGAFASLQFGAPLNAICEESEDEDDSDNSEASAVKRNAQAHTRRLFCEKKQYEGLSEGLDEGDVLQAFSCFTYKVASRRRYLVCDLQGTFEEGGNSPLYRLTDPAIHTSALAQEEIRQKFHADTGSDANNGSRIGTTLRRFGRTDRGQDGIDDFFRTHQCSKLCKMLGSRRLRSSNEDIYATQTKNGHQTTSDFLRDLDQERRLKMRNESSHQKSFRPI